ncbi:S24 family peptidase [Ammoniphilus sp. YIM 78166]|uniref:S24 family peptidase n=1 Tax=Ammoniphilus sp. YIM 78166 TaxID=1644106 RepID=UPI0014319E84|nr:S24 family peptidase [Ammoniphilus sp. YIM 78166]
MPVWESVSAEGLDPVDQFPLDIWFEFSFAIEVTDDGFEEIGIEPGDILLFRECSWPDRNGEIVLAAYEGEDFYLRVLEQIDTYGPVIYLRGTGDVPLIKTTKDSIIVKGTAHYFFQRSSSEIKKVNTEAALPF